MRESQEDQEREEIIWMVKVETQLMNGINYIKPEKLNYLY